MENNKTLEKEYYTVKTHKKILASFVDLFLFIFTVVVIFSVINIGYQNLEGPYKNSVNENKSLRIESKLYDENDVLITEEIDSSTTMTYQQKKNELSYALNYFYSSSTFFTSNEGKEIYESRKKEAIVDNQALFVLKDDIYVEIENIAPEKYYNFYKDEIENHALVYLNNNEKYVNNERKIFLILVLTILVISIIVYSIYYLILPLTVFKRGRQTLGMKLFKFSLIGVNALNVKTSKYIGRCVFNFFVMYLLNVFSFFIPSLISLGMLFFSKRKQNLTNYIFNDYFVDTTVDEIYLNFYEYLDKNEFDHQIKIEDKNLKMH